MPCGQPSRGILLKEAVGELAEFNLLAEEEESSAEIKAEDIAEPLLAVDVRVWRDSRRPAIERFLKDRIPILLGEVHQLRLGSSQRFPADALDGVPIPLPLAAARARGFIEGIPVTHEDGGDVVALLEEHPRGYRAVDSSAHRREDFGTGRWWTP